jgi:hypothetical protein
LPAEDSCFPPGDVEKPERLRRIAQDQTTIRQIRSLPEFLRHSEICAQNYFRRQKQAAENPGAVEKDLRFDSGNKPLRPFHRGSLELIASATTLAKANESLYQI